MSTRSSRTAWLFVLALGAGCSDAGTDPPDPTGGDPTGTTSGSTTSSSTTSSSTTGGGTGGQMMPDPPDPSMDFGRDILSTALVLDVTALTGKATIELAASESTGASFEAAGLSITAVSGKDGPLLYEIHDGRLDVGVPLTSGEPAELTIDYSFTKQKNFDGYLETGVTFLWTRFCGNLFPCKSAPDDGVTFTMEVTNAPAGMDAVYPKSIPSQAPSYMPAFAIGDYEHTELGVTTAGTKVGVWYLPGGQANAMMGAADLPGWFDWYEKTYGAYLYGSEVGTVEAAWGPGAYGGMEHHPLWHIGSDSMSDPVTHAHEAAHGWFGNGVRIRCWEDFVLSEGTVSYLAARAIEAVGGAAEGQAVWDDYKADLDAAVANADTIAWPQTCNVIDLINDPLWSTVPYMKGAFFYKDVEAQVGAAALDAALAKFYATYGGKAAGMQDMLDTIKAETGFDPGPLAQGWLKSLGTP